MRVAQLLLTIAEETKVSVSLRKPDTDEGVKRSSFIGILLLQVRQGQEAIIDIDGTVPAERMYLDRVREGLPEIELTEIKK
jgi:phosphotransferase system HPr-like phosphotransfer protein